jgi:matrixin
MDVRAARLLSVAPVVFAACTGTPSAPSGPSSTRMLVGQTVSAIQGAAATGMSVRVGNARAVTSDSSGYFDTDISEPGTYTTTVTGNGYVERATAVEGPGAQRIRVSLIPTSFDLSAFNEMCRTANSRLQRWATRPSLVVLGSVMSYRGGTGFDYTATGERLSDDETAELVAHLTEGLSLLTGGMYTSFASTEIVPLQGGERVSMARTGKIVVGRFTGILSGLGETVGYGTWQEQADGTVVAGMMFLDRDFDRNDSRRRLLRIHELGHALGYLHVTAQSSIMNPWIGPEPSEFDRNAATIAFQRPPGNTSPDSDPAATSRAFSVNARWADLVR